MIQKQQVREKKKMLILFFDYPEVFYQSIVSSLLTNENHFFYKLLILIEIYVLNKKKGLTLQFPVNNRQLLQNFQQPYKLLQDCNIPKKNFYLGCINKIFQFLCKLKNIFFQKCNFRYINQIQIFFIKLFFIQLTERSY